MSVLGRAPCRAFYRVVGDGGDGYAVPRNIVSRPKDAVRIAANDPVVVDQYYEVMRWNMNHFYDGKHVYVRPIGRISRQYEVALAVGDRAEALSLGEEMDGVHGGSDIETAFKDADPLLPGRGLNCDNEWSTCRNARSGIIYRSESRWNRWNSTRIGFLTGKPAM
jgi:hypothetical protein